VTSGDLVIMRFTVFDKLTTAGITYLSASPSPRLKLSLGDKKCISYITALTRLESHDHHRIIIIHNEQIVVASSFIFYGKNNKQLSREKSL